MSSTDYGFDGLDEYAELFERAARGQLLPDIAPFRLVSIECFHRMYSSCYFSVFKPQYSRMAPSTIFRSLSISRRLNISLGDFAVVYPSVWVSK